eukprot:TRINITY_DN2220_c0_g2_i1.p1 TRINITY_DN2220_c0_g2~~TRINITY_DN2220_c0_g2_i1.p1  ORF type:complete len:118 (-),score=12.18 TRINITY_DN2220_c0_g2_i1:247-600(-)
MYYWCQSFVTKSEATVDSMMKQFASCADYNSVNASLGTTAMLFCFVLFCFVLFCFVLFCFVFGYFVRRSIQDFKELCGRMMVLGFGQRNIVIPGGDTDMSRPPVGMCLLLIGNHALS